MWSINRRGVSALIVGVLACSLASCYTLLKHPKTGEPAEDMDFASCTDCHESYPYPGPYDEIAPWDLPPWWYPPVVVVRDGPTRRTVIDREQVERLDSQGLIGRRRIEPPPGVNPGPGAIMPPVGAGGQAATPDAGEPAVIKRSAPGNDTGTRQIESKKAAKENDKASAADSKRSGDTKDKQ